MTRLWLALGFLTRLPVPAVSAPAAEFAAAIRCYPLVGIVIGLCVWAASWIGALVDPWTGALAALLMWTWVTGALHLDGLADLADGLGAAHGDRGRLLAVMADPHIGSFGAVTLALHLLAKLVLLHACLPLGWGIVLVPAAARIGPLCWAHWLPPIAPGLGASIARAARTRDVIGWMAVLAGGAMLVPALLAAPVLILGHAGWLQRRLGGVNGDAHGAGIELVETGLLFALALAGTLR